MTTTFKSGLTAAAFSAILGLSAFSATAAPLQSSATEQGATARPVAQETKVEHDRARPVRSASARKAWVRHTI